MSADMACQSGDECGDPARHLLVEWGVVTGDFWGETAVALGQLRGDLTVAAEAADSERLTGDLSEEDHDAIHRHLMGGESRRRNMTRDLSPGVALRTPEISPMPRSGRLLV